VNGNNPPTANSDPIQQTILQDLLNGGLVSPVLLERLFGHACGELVESIGIGRRDPWAGTPPSL
jgi:hypothetical protein